MTTLVRWDPFREITTLQNEMSRLMGSLTGGTLPNGGNGPSRTWMPAVYEAFGARDQRELRELTADEAEALLPDLPAGSMRPKVEAAVDLARAGGETLITSQEALHDALAGRAGTRIS